MSTQKSLSKPLEQILLQDEPDSLRAAVAQEALDCEDIQAFFRDLLEFGCRCGVIGSLILHRDTYAFFDHHYEEIMFLREEVEESTGVPLQIGFNLKNELAWFAFEETAHRMARELGINF